MKAGPPGSFGAQLKAFREAAGYTQEELATIAGLSVHSISALERGERRRPHVETVRALLAALDLTGPAREALLESARPPVHDSAADELSLAPLPLAPTPLVGRDADCGRLRQWLADPAARLITLTGPGGVGKTRLALELARTMAADGAARVVFVPLAAVRDPSFVPLAIIEALGLADVTAGELPARARAACAEPTLLVLDNFEQVLEAAPLVSALLIAAATVRVLATSRAPLRLRGEREYPVGPLELETSSESLSPADVVRAPAVRLFVERVRDVQPDFRLTTANGPTVTAICRRLDALPLALELAAPWMKILPAEDLLRRLVQDGLLSSAGHRDLPERQQTMSATVAWSYRLLEADEQRVFRRLAVLPGRFPIEAAAAVVAGGTDADEDARGVLDTAAALIDKSLLLRAETAADSRPLYRMLETVRAYALQTLTAGEREDALDGLARYCCREAARAGDGLLGPAQREWLDRVRDDLENYRRALAVLIERGRGAEAAGIAWHLAFFWLIRGSAAEGLQWYEQTLSVPGLPAHATARALVGAAMMSYTQGHADRARDLATRALPATGTAGDPTALVHAENLLGHLEHAAGRADAAEALFARAVDGFRALDIAWGAGNALLGRAGIALARRDVARAERLLDEASRELQRAGPWFLNLTLYVRAILAVGRSDPDTAIACVRQSLECSRELHDRFAFLYALAPLAAAAALKGNHAWAARILGLRDAVTERAGATAVDKSVHDLGTRTERDVRAHLGEDRWARAYAAGRRASIDTLMKEIDAACAAQI